MHVIVLYIPGTPIDRDIARFQEQLAQRGLTLELVDADSREGSALAELHDLLQRPTTLITNADGQIIRSWEGGLPTLDEINAYTMAS